MQEGDFLRNKLVALFVKEMAQNAGLRVSRKIGNTRNQ